MDAVRLIARLESGPGVFRALLEGVAEDELQFRPDPHAWSMLEVLCHLLDEEREDFRVRLDLLLHQPEAEWPPIDPRAWVTGRSYAQRDAWRTLDEFESERHRSVRWLRDLGPFDASRRKVHPKFGTMTAGSLLGAWAAHDVLHARQLTRLRYLFTRRLSEPHDTGYAGEW